MNWPVVWFMAWHVALIFLFAGLAVTDSRFNRWLGLVVLALLAVEFAISGIVNLLERKGVL